MLVSLCFRALDDGMPPSVGETAIDALDALPETHDKEWYKRLVEAAEAATQAELIAKGRIETH